MVISWDDPSIAAESSSGGQWKSWRWSRTIFAFDPGNVWVRRASENADGFGWKFRDPHMVYGDSMVIQWDLIGFNGIYDGIPSGKRLHNYGKIHYFWWENPRNQWPISSSQTLRGPGRVYEQYLRWNTTQGVWNFDPPDTRMRILIKTQLVDLGTLWWTNIAMENGHL